MKFKVLKSFSDKENKCIQPEGKVIELDEERAHFIVSKQPDLIELVEDDRASSLEFPKHVGGGLYLLSNGEKIKGKDKALEAEEILKVKE